MNNVYDLAHELARSLKETDQYKNYASVKARVDAEPALAKMVNDFQEKNMEVQTQMMLNGGKAPEEMMQQVQQLYAVVAQDPLAAQYFAAEMSYTQVVSEIYGILGEAVRFEK
ncbi:MAG: YlbF family regulator [Firmicutes bacterium]|nr:YlbF family regulator [Bacillota bacterium]